MTMPPNPQRMGSDRLENGRVGGYSAFYGIKTNGTLWNWDLNLAGATRSIWPDGLKSGTNSDWSKFY